MNFTFIVYSGAAALFCVAALRVWISFGNGKFVADFARTMAVAFLKDAWKIVGKRKSPIEEAIDREYYRRGETRPTKFNPHPRNGGSR